MNSVIKEIKKYFNVYIAFVKNCIIAQMEYRFNFYISFLFDCAFLLTRIIYVAVVYQTQVEINGLSADQILIFIGTFTIMSGIYGFFYVNNFFRISDYIRQGNLDLLMVKPISLQFMVTLRYVDLGISLPDLIGGTIMVIVACMKLNISVSFTSILGYLLLLISGTIIMYVIFLLPHILSFWIVKTTAINNIVDALFEFNNMPMFIYSKWMQRIGLFLVPLFAISNFPAMFLLNLMTIKYIIWAIAAPIILLVILRLVWNLAIKNYTSASS